MVELGKTRAGSEFPWFLQRKSSAVGGLAAAGTLLMSHGRLSQRRGPRFALVLLLLILSLPSEGLLPPYVTFSTTSPVPSRLALGAVFLHFVVLFTVVVI